MATLETISDKIELAQAYYAELMSSEILDLKNSLQSSITKRLTCLNRLIRSLSWDVADEVNDQITQDIYDLLLVEISDYSGASLTVDPNVVIPGTSIVVTGTEKYMNKTQGDLVDANPPNEEYYLPFLDNNGQAFPIGYAPTAILVNGNTFDGWQYQSGSGRITGFANNDAQIINVLVQYIQQ